MQKNKKIKIFVCYHKKSKLFSNKYLTPIHSGRSFATKHENFTSDLNWLKKNMIGDDTGDNISEKNPYYNEVDIIYWIWKNYDKIGNPDYVGLNHYRRFFKINYSRIDKYLEKFDLIYLNKPSFDEGIYRQWKNTYHYSNFDENGIDELLNVLKAKSQIEYEEFLEYANSPNKGGFMNLFIMKRENFFNYCQWLFPILLELENRVSLNNRTVGMLAERMTSYYLQKLEKSGLRTLKTSLTDIPPMMSLDYILSQILSIKKVAKNNGQEHFQINLLGLKISIKA